VVSGARERVGTHPDKGTAMLHIVFGSVLLLLAVAMAVRRHRYSRFHRLRRLFGALRATPAQERALRDLVHSARDQLRQIHLETRELRREVGDIVRADRFDEARFDGAEAKLGEKLRQATAVIRSTLAQIHEILDGVQRAQVADWLSGTLHCYRSHYC
jgi:Spy/CpxP family protein refolding chaperone